MRYDEKDNPLNLEWGVREVDRDVLLREEFIHPVGLLMRKI